MFDKMFKNLKNPRSLLNYTLMRGTTDWTQLEQFNLYEKGFPFLIVVGIPEFLRTTAQKNARMGNLIKNYVHILEYEFRGMSGLADLTASTSPITNGFNDFNVITRTQEQGSETFTFNYTEKSGSTLSKVQELYLRGVRDPNSGFKHYNGLIAKNGGEYDPTLEGTVGFEKETFSFLYLHTDNTGLLLERAVFLVGAQPTNAPFSTLYNADKGTIEFAEIGVEFMAYPIYGNEVDKRAQQILDWMNNEAKNTYYVARNSYDYKWSRVSPTDFRNQSTNVYSGTLQDTHLTSDSGNDASWIAPVSSSSTSQKP